MGVPDKAAGRAVKCKGCGARVPVPGGKNSSGQPAKKKKKKRKKKRAPAAEPSFDDYDDGGGGYDDPFGGMNLRSVEDSHQTVCPKCTKPVDEEDIECPHCGVNIETGALSEEQRKKKARKGPPPEEFYGAVWGNAWEFLKAHKGFAVKTGFNWGFSLAMVLLSAFVLAWYIPAREKELIDSAEGAVSITATYVLIEPTDDQDAKYDNVKYGPGSTRLTNGRLVLAPPRLAAINSPPAYFWAFVFVVFFVGCTGWAWTLAAKVVEVTMSGQKKIKRFQGDIYKNMMKGFITVFWPSVLMVPVAWIPSAMMAGGADPQVCSIIALCIYALPFLIFLPIAVVHMAQPYTYRAWLINWVGKDFFNTLGPCLYVSAMFFGLVVLLPAGIVAGIGAGWGHVANFYVTNIEGPVIAGIFGTGEESSWTFALGRVPLMFLFSFTVCTFVSMLVAFPAVFMMRVFGLFGLYFRPDLALCYEQVPLSNAGFGPRYLAFQIDALIVMLICGAGALVALIVSKVFGYLYSSPTAGFWVFMIAFLIDNIGGILFYFANWESGSGRATLGKWSLGLIVVREDNQPMTRKQAVQRTLSAALNLFTFYIPFIMCAFRKDHRALHDQMSKTKVVWRGDEDM